MSINFRFHILCCHKYFMVELDEYSYRCGKFIAMHVLRKTKCSPAIIKHCSLCTLDKTMLFEIPNIYSECFRTISKSLQYFDFTNVPLVSLFAGKYQTHSSERGDLYASNIGSVTMTFDLFATMMHDIRSAKYG